MRVRASSMPIGSLPPMTSGPTRSEHQRLLEKLQGVRQAGGCVPLPFLRAADVPPLALLADVQEPYLGRSTPQVGSLDRMSC